MDNNDSVNTSSNENSKEKPTPEQLLSSLFYKTPKNKYSPILKPETKTTHITQLFTSLYPPNNFTLSQLKTILDTLSSLFSEYPPLIQLLHGNLEKGFLYKQLILLEIHLIESSSNISNKEDLNSLTNSIKNLIQLSVKYYDCPRIYYDLIYKKIASLTLWKEEGFDIFSFPPEMFQHFIELLQVLYEAGNTEHKMSFIIPKKYFVMNGCSSMCFTSETISHICLKNRIFVSWFFIPNYQYHNGEETSIIEMKIKSKKKNKNDIKQIGIYVNYEKHNIYFQDGENKLYLDIERLKHSKWYAIKYSFPSGNIILYDTCDNKTYLLQTKQRIDDDISLNDIMLYKNFFGISTCSFIIKLPSSDSNQNLIFPGIEESLSNKENGHKDPEKKLYNRFNKYGIYNSKVKNYFCKKIYNKDINFDILVSPFQLYTKDNNIYIEHNEINGYIKEKENVDCKYYTIVNHNYDLKRINLIGGVNVFLPLFEIVLSSKDKYLEKEEYICSLLELVANVVGKNKFNYMNATHSKFFNCLGLFMEKIRKEIYGRKIWEKLLWIHRVFEGLCYSFPDDVKKNITKYNSYYQYVMFNYKLFGKFNIDVLTIVCKNIYDNLENLERADDPQGDATILKKALYDSFNLKTLTFYLRKLDQYKYNRYCCLDHKNLLKNPNEQIVISDPSMKQKLTIFEKIIIKLLLNEFVESENDIKGVTAEIFFQTLTMDISPCFQEYILSLLKKILKDVLRNNKAFLNFLKRIHIIDILVFLIATSYYPIRLLVFEFISEHRDILLSLTNTPSNNNIFTIEQFIVIALCSKPITIKRKDNNSILYNTVSNENQLILNSEYKETEKYFKGNNIKDEEFMVKYGENFIFFNVHPEINEDLESKYYRTLFPLLNKNIFKDNKSFWFECLLLNISQYSNKVILDEITSLFNKEMDFKGNAKYSFQKEYIKSESFVFTLLEICFTVYCNESKRGDPQYENLIPAIYDSICNEHVDYSFYQNFLIWFMYHFVIFTSIKEEYNDERKMNIYKLFKFFEEKIIKHFLNDTNYSLMNSKKTEAVAYFISIYYDYLFSLDKSIEFVYSDNDMCHLIFSSKSNDFQLFDGNNIKGYNTVVDRKNILNINIPKYFYINDQRKVNSIETFFFPFGNLLMNSLQMKNTSNLKDIEDNIKNYYESTKKKPKGSDTSIVDYFGLLFCSPHLIEEEKRRTKCETKIEKLDWSQESKPREIDLSKYQFMEGGRAMTIILYYYLLHIEDKSSRLDACKLIRDLILYMLGHGIRYFWYNNNFDSGFSDPEPLMDLLRNSIFILFKMLLQELYPKDKMCQYDDKEKTKIKIYIASLLLFNELIEPQLKGRDQKFIFNIFANIKKEENSPIQFTLLKSKKKPTLQNFIDIIQDTKEIISDEYWNYLNFPSPNVNEKGEIDYFQKSKVVHNSRKLLYEIQKFIPIFPIDINKINVLKFPGIILHYDSSSISYQNYIKLCTFQKQIAYNYKESRTEFKQYKKKVHTENERNLNIYRSIKKHLFSWRNSWSNHDYFYTQPFKLKQKILNHYNKDFAQFMLIPIMDINSYLPDFRFFKKENLFLEETNVINLDVKQIFPPTQVITIPNKKDEKNTSTFLLDLYDHFEWIEQIHKNKKKDSLSNVSLCLIKKTHHIKCTLYTEDMNCLLFEFIYQEQGSGIDKKEILYDEDNDTCFGSFFKGYKKDQYKTFLSIPYNDFAFFFEKKYFYKNAIEIFTTHNKSYLFHGNETSINTLKTFIMERISSLFPIKIKPIDHDILGYISGKLQNKYFPDKKGFYFIDILNMWKTNKISSFAFLIMSNLFGGRSFQDLTQYPIFPWTIMNYLSDTLNMENDLRLFDCPMGNIDYYNSGRSKQFQSEYKEMEKESKQKQNEDNDDDDECEEEKRKSLPIKTKSKQQIIWENLDNEPFYYGTHYSNPMYVSHYLSRILPFSQLRIELQGDNFDVSRLFSSIEKAFQSATTQSTDVRELIPEFFTLPEMFININKLNFGIEDTDVELPKWANGSAYEFVKIYRMSLESDECQKDLNQWFDLIFGYKQLGIPAKEAKNIFMNHTYWGKVNIEYDNRKKYTKDEENLINFFLRNAETGLSPRQLLQDKNTNKQIKKQDVKGLDKSTENDNWNFKLIPLPPEHIIFCSNDKLNVNDFCFMSSDSKLLYSNLSDERNTAFTRSTYINDNIEKYNIRNYSKHKANYYILEPRLCFININYWDNCIREYDLSNNNNNPQMIYCQEDNSLITSIVMSNDNSFAVIGTQKGSLIVYTITEEIEETKGSTILSFFRGNKNKNKRIWKHINIINDHYAEITAIAIKEELNILISSDKDGYVNIYTLPCFKLIRSLHLKGLTKHIFISDSPLPCFVTFANNEFQAFSLNGNEIKINDIDKSLRNCNENQKNNDIMDCAYYRDHNWKEFLIIGTLNGNVEIRSFPEMKLLTNVELPEGKDNTIMKIFILNEKTIIVLTDKFKLYKGSNN